MISGLHASSKCKYCLVNKRSLKRFLFQVPNIFQKAFPPFQRNKGNLMLTDFKLNEFMCESFNSKWFGTVKNISSEVFVR